MKCIILAGGKGTRLGPSTLSLSKQILPVYDKPLIYYPLSLAILSGLKDVLIISSIDHIGFYQKLFDNGTSLGLNISYKEQASPRGIAEAFLLGEEFLNGDSVCLILGDNIFYGHGLSNILEKIVSTFKHGAHIFGYAVHHPEEYGVLTLDTDNNVIDIEEKPIQPKSKYAVPGLYYYDNTVVTKAKQLKPSARNELEITSINNLYIKERLLKVELLGRGFAWFDTGNPDNMLDAANFISSIQRIQNIQIACLEEICYKKGFITKNQLKERYEILKNSKYGEYLKDILNE